MNLKKKPLNRKRADKFDNITPLVNSGFSTLIEKLDLICDKVDRLESKVDKFDNAIFHPDDGLFARLKQENTERKNHDTEINGQVSEILEWKKFIHDELELPKTLNIHSSQLKSLTSVVQKAFGAVKWLVVSVLGGVIMLVFKLLYARFSSN